MGTPAPLRFGAPGRELAGLFHPAEAAPRARAIVVCNPFGQEAIRFHRLLRVHAERLARAGFPVLRFDYFATGDADGDDAEGTLAAWTEDVVAASDEALRRSGLRETTWLGVRLGGTLAVDAARRARLAPRQLVLWEPIVDGTAYLHELAHAHLAADEVDETAAAGTAPAIADLHEALGFPLTVALKAELAAITPRRFADIPVPVTLVAGARAATATAALPAARLVHLDGDITWNANDAVQTSLVPPAGLQAIVAALEAHP